MYVYVFLPVSLANWDSSCWTFTLESSTESFTTALTPRTARPDRSDSSSTTESPKTGLATSCETWPVCCELFRRRREEKRPAALQRARSRSWRPARLGTPSSAGTATSCDLNGLPVILWLNATPQGSGRGLGLGRASGTEQQHPTPLLKRETSRREGWRKRRRKRRTGVQSTTQPCWNNLYFHNSFTYNFYFGSKGKGGYRRKCVWAGVRGIRESREVFLLLFSGACKYLCATWESHCWSKLNAEFSFYFNLFFYITRLFVEKKDPEQFPHSNRMVLICG